MKIDQFRSRVPSIALFSMIIILPLFMQAQEKLSLVKGLVTNESGEPLSNVSVIIRNTGTNFTSGTSTDSTGVFTFSRVPSGGPYTFNFSSVGFEPQTLSGYSIKSDVTLSLVVDLKQAGNKLSEVVVTALGIKRQAKSLTYSTQNVSTKQLTEARELNIMNSLAGKVAGLSINSSGSGVGAPARVILRGNRSISGDSQPLYVVDGVPIVGDPTDLSLDNVASIDVLKGPNAAALYGSAAQNGAIIITTKRGRRGINVSLNSSYIIQDPVILTQFQNEYGQGQGGVYDKGSEFSWGPRMEGQIVDHWSPDPTMAGQTYALTPQPDNNIDAFRRGYNMSHNVSINAGGEKAQTIFSYTLTDAKGIIPGNDLSRHNLSARVSNELSKRLSFDGKIDYMRQEIKNGYFGGRYNPTQMIYRLPRSIQTGQISDFEYVDAQGKTRQNYFNPGSAIGGNPYWIMNRTPNTTNRERVIALASLSYDVTEALKLMIRASYDGARGSSEERLYNDNYASAPDGRYTVGKGNNLEFNTDFLLSYDTDLNKDWNFNGNIGGNIKKQRNDFLSSNTGAAMIVPNFFAMSNTNFPLTTYNPGPNQDIQSLYAFGRIGWRDALFLDVTGRNDWSSTLPANNRSFFYPSVGLSAVLSDLVKNLPGQISYAKVRASWAQVGNSAPPYMLQRTATFSAGGANGFLQLSSTLPNPNLLPEKTKSIEGGFDVRLLENRLGLDLTVYKTNTTNQLFTVALPVGSGASQYFTNGGDVENKGVELVLTSTPIQGKNLNWNLNLNFSANRNTVKKISDERPTLNLTPNGFFSNFVIEQGKPYGNIYSRGFLRDSLGRVVIGANGLPRITNGMTVLVGNFNPDWIGSVMNSLSYKELSVSFLIEHRQGGTVASETDAILYADGVTEQTLAGRDKSLVFGENLFPGEEAVMADGSKNVTKIDAETFWRSVGGRNTPVGEVFVNDATNTRLRELTIGYTLPRKILGRLPISSIKASIVGRNLFFIYKASPNLDPDFMGGTGPTSEGTQAFTPATTRTYGINLKVGF